MPIGPGRYDDLCTLVREQANSDGAIVIIVGGPAGDGFSCQADLATTLRLPGMLDSISAQIRKSGPFAPPPPVPDNSKNDPEVEQRVEAAHKLACDIDEQLSELHHLQQGSVLADLVATYFARHSPDCREDAIALFNEMSRSLIEASLLEMRLRGTLPPGWEKQ